MLVCGYLLTVVPEEAAAVDRRRRAYAQPYDGYSGLPAQTSYGGVRACRVLVV
jgi:hypothetical protein